MLYSYHMEGERPLSHASRDSSPERGAKAAAPNHILAEDQYLSSKTKRHQAHHAIGGSILTESNSELMCRGMACLTEALGVVEAEEFISLVLRERFDYTKGQRTYFDKLPSGAFHTQALDYAAKHPYEGGAEML